MIAACTILEKMVRQAGRSVFPKTFKLHSFKEPFHLMIFLLYFISPLILCEIYCLFYLLKFACSKNCKSCHSLFDGCLPLLRSQIKSSLLEKDWISIITLPNFNHCINLFHRKTKHANFLRFFKFLRRTQKIRLGRWQMTMMWKTLFVFLRLLTYSMMTVHKLSGPCRPGFQKNE